MLGKSASVGRARCPAIQEEIDRRVEHYQRSWELYGEIHWLTPRVREDRTARARRLQAIRGAKRRQATAEALRVLRETQTVPTYGGNTTQPH